MQSHHQDSGFSSSASTEARPYRSGVLPKLYPQEQPKSRGKTPVPLSLAPPGMSTPGRNASRSGVQHRARGTRDTIEFPASPRARRQTSMGPPSIPTSKKRQSSMPPVPPAHSSASVAATISTSTTTAASASSSGRTSLYNKAATASLAISKRGTVDPSATRQDTFSFPYFRSFSTANHIDPTTALPTSSPEQENEHVRSQHDGSVVLEQDEEGGDQTKYRAQKRIRSGDKFEEEEQSVALGEMYDEEHDEEVEGTVPDDDNDDDEDDEDMQGFSSVDEDKSEKSRRKKHIERYGVPSSPPTSGHMSPFILDPRLILPQMFPRSEIPHLDFVKAHVEASDNTLGGHGPSEKYGSMTMAEWEAEGERMATKFQNLVGRVVKISLRQAASQQAMKDEIAAQSASLATKDRNMVDTGHNLLAWARQLVGDVGGSQSTVSGSNQHASELDDMRAFQDPVSDN